MALTLACIGNVLSKRSTGGSQRGLMILHGRTHIREILAGLEPAHFVITSIRTPSLFGLNQTVLKCYSVGEGFARVNYAYLPVLQ